MNVTLAIAATQPVQGGTATVTVDTIPSGVMAGWTTVESLLPGFEVFGPQPLGIGPAPDLTNPETITLNFWPGPNTYNVHAKVTLIMSDGSRMIAASAETAVVVS